MFLLTSYDTPLTQYWPNFSSLNADKEDFSWSGTTPCLQVFSTMSKNGCVFVSPAALEKYGNVDQRWFVWCCMHAMKAPEGSSVSFSAWVIGIGKLNNKPINRFKKMYNHSKIKGIWFSNLRKVLIYVYKNIYTLAFNKLTLIGLLNVKILIPIIWFLC